jgi:hypothetical protein
MPLPWLFLIMASATAIWVVVPLEKAHRYDVSSSHAHLTMVDTDDRRVVLSYRAPIGCPLASARIVKRGRTLVFDIPCLLDDSVEHARNNHRAPVVAI